MASEKTAHCDEASALVTADQVAVANAQKRSRPASSDDPSSLPGPAKRPALSDDKTTSSTIEEQASATQPLCPDPEPNGSYGPATILDAEANFVQNKNDKCAKTTSEAPEGSLTPLQWPTKPPGSASSEKPPIKTAEEWPVKERPYCTEKCLLALAQGGDSDPACPNFEQHPAIAPPVDTVCVLLRRQLTTEPLEAPYCWPFIYQGISGSKGKIYKVCLRCYGYTFVVKAVEKGNRQFMLDEADMYESFRAWQGKYTTVCLGCIELNPTQLFGSLGDLVTMLLLSYGGQSLESYSKMYASTTTPQTGRLICHQTKEALAAMHRQYVVHRSFHPRNVLFDGYNVRVIDFERAETAVEHRFECGIRRFVDGTKSKSQREEALQAHNWLKDRFSLCECRDCFGK